ncbi:putative universal stress protein A-like protein-like [Capsicum annuum]|nr:putative universal stress protein A-like protein-like [Capsicum annuum]
MEVVVFGLVELGREGLDFVEVLDFQVPLAELEEFGNVLVYCSHGLEGYAWFDLRHFVELVKDLAFGAMFREFQISTLATKLGVRNIAFLGSGLLLTNYIGAVVAAIYIPQAFRSSLMIPVHVILALCLVFQAWLLERANYTKVSVVEKTRENENQNVEEEEQQDIFDDRLDDPDMNIPDDDQTPTPVDATNTLGSSS